MSQKLVRVFGPAAILLSLAICGMLISTRLASQTAPTTPAGANIPAVVQVSSNPTGSCTMNGTLNAPAFITINVSTGVQSRCVSGTWVTDTFTSAGGTFNVNGAQIVDATGALNSNVSGESPTYTAYGNATLAQLNAGLQIVPDVASRTVKVLNEQFSAVGAAPATCTAIGITDSSAVVAATVTIAALSAAGVQVTTETAPALGAWTFTTMAWQGGLTAGKGLKLVQTGSACATMTSLNYKVLYTYQ